MKYCLIVGLLFTTNAAFAQNTGNSPNGYVQDANKIYADFLAGKKLIDKNYIIVNNCLGFDFDASKNNKLTYNKYFTGFILDAMNTDSLSLKLFMGSIPEMNQNCVIGDYFFNQPTTIVYAPVVVMENKFFLCKRVKRTDAFNFTEMFMVQMQFKNKKMKVLKTSGSYD